MECSFLAGKSQKRRPPGQRHGDEMTGPAQAAGALLTPVSSFLTHSFPRVFLEWGFSPPKLYSELTFIHLLITYRMPDPRLGALDGTSFRLQNKSALIPISQMRKRSLRVGGSSLSSRSHKPGNRRSWLRRGPLPEPASLPWVRTYFSQRMHLAMSLSQIPIL